MTRSTLLPLGLITILVLSGCSIAEAQRYPTPRRGGDVYRPADHRDDRYDRRDEYRGVDRRVRTDIRQYVNLLDRELRLTDRQEYRVTEILEGRAQRYLTEGRYRRAYPFPRSFRRGGEQNRDVREFWRDADSRISRVLNRQQTREYRQITDGRGRYDRNDRYDDDRYDDRRRDDRRGRDRD